VVAKTVSCKRDTGVGFIYSISTVIRVGCESVFLMFFIQQYFICRPSVLGVSEDAEIEPRTATTSALAVRRSNQLG
jgi:hypothetical protein